MLKLNIHHAKTHLSKYLEKMRITGEKIILCNRNVPVAEIAPILKKQNTNRAIGLAKGEFKLTKKFFEPLPIDVIEEFYKGK